jgi:hypothetical protein
VAIPGAADDRRKQDAGKVRVCGAVREAVVADIRAGTGQGKGTKAMTRRPTLQPAVTISAKRGKGSAVSAG